MLLSHTGNVWKGFRVVASIWPVCGQRQEWKQLLCGAPEGTLNELALSAEARVGSIHMAVRHRRVLARLERQFLRALQKKQSWSSTLRDSTHYSWSPLRDTRRRRTKTEMIHGIMTSWAVHESEQPWRCWSEPSAEPRHRESQPAGEGPCPTTGTAEELEGGPSQTSAKLRSWMTPQVKREVMGNDVELLIPVSLQTAFLASLNIGFLCRR